MIRDRENGLIVDAGDVAALRGALQWCLDERAALSAMRPRALETARARQWSDFRADHRAAIDRGLARAGFGVLPWPGSASSRQARSAPTRASSRKPRP